MKELLEAMTIFAEYTNLTRPTNCVDGVLTVLVPSFRVSEADIKRLAEIGFIPDEQGTVFYSEKYGSAY